MTIRYLLSLLLCLVASFATHGDPGLIEASDSSTSPQRYTVANQDLVKLVYAHPKEMEGFYKAWGEAQFTAVIRSIEPAAWASDPTGFSKFSKKAPNAARVIALWVVGGVTPAPTPPPPPPPQPAPGGEAWREKIVRPMFFMSAPSYFWGDVPDAHIRPWLTMIRDEGLTGPSLEFNGPFPVYEYNGQRIKNLDVAGVYRAQFAAWRKWLPVIRELGLVAHISFLNSNQSDANRMPDSWWFETARAFAQEFGPDNMLILGLNETDERTRASVGANIYAGLEAGGFPKSQMIGYSSQGPYGYAEHHPKDIASIRRGDYRTLNIPDHGQAIKTVAKPLIRGLYGPNWQGGGSPQTSQITQFTDAVQAAGTGGGLYSFGRVPDPVGLQTAGKAWRR